MGKSAINGDVQELCVKLPEGRVLEIGLYIMFQESSFHLGLAAQVLEQNLKVAL